MNQRVVCLGITLLSVAAIFMGCEPIESRSPQKIKSLEKAQSVSQPLAPKEETVSNTDPLFVEFDRMLQEMETRMAQLNEDAKIKWSEKVQMFKKREEELRKTFDPEKFDTLNQELQQALKETSESMRSEVEPIKKEVGGMIENAQKDLSSAGNHLEQKMEEASSEIRSGVSNGVRYYRETTSEKMESIKEEIRYRSE